MSTGKKQPVYLLCKKNGELTVTEDKGYIIDLTDNYGNTVKIALMYKSGWHATHYDTGLACTPYTDVNRERVLRWSWEGLIERLKHIDFGKILKNNPYIEAYKSKIEDYKKEHTK